MSTLFVQERQALLDLCGQLALSRWIAVDTEFVRESTYYAKLGLVQVANEKVAACIDPLAIDLSPLLDILYGPTILKVLHAARQDLEVLYDLRRDVPRPVFDTQVAAALLGHPAQIGYGTLVETITGVKLPKLHTRTNWEARPLSEEQLRYAADDVIYLREVYERLHADLTSRGRLAWLAEECEALTDVKLYRNDPEAAHARLGIGHALPPSMQPLLKALSTWRERTAQARDRPRSWIAPDAALMDIARTMPGSVDALRALESVSPSFVQAHGSEIVSVVQQAKALVAEHIWIEPKPPTPAEKDLARRLNDRVGQVARENSINPEIIATRRTVFALIRDRAGPLTRGWRYELIGRELMTLL